MFSLCRYKNGAEFDGYFRDDLENGFGILTYPPDKICLKFEGFWRNGKKCGKGTLYYNDGTKYTGNFHNNTMQGTQFLTLLTLI
jgi:hypothetical protein